MNGYVKYFDNNNKCIKLVHDKELLQKYNKIQYSIKKRGLIVNQSIMTNTLKLK